MLTVSDLRLDWSCWWQHISGFSPPSRTWRTPSPWRSAASPEPPLCYRVDSHGRRCSVWAGRRRTQSHAQLRPRWTPSQSWMWPLTKNNNDREDSSRWEQKMFESGEVLVPSVWYLMGSTGTSLWRDPWWPRLQEEWREHCPEPRSPRSGGCGHPSHVQSGWWTGAGFQGRRQPQPDGWTQHLVEQMVRF